MNTPDKPGTWTVRHRDGFKAVVEVCRDSEGGLESCVPGYNRWHPVQWLAMNGWSDWRPKREGVRVSRAGKQHKAFWRSERRLAAKAKAQGCEHAELQAAIRGHAAGWVAGVAWAKRQPSKDVARLLAAWNEGVERWRRSNDSIPAAFVKLAHLVGKLERKL